MAAGSFIHNRSLRFYRSTAHPMLSVFIPFLFLISLDQILRAHFTPSLAAGPLMAIILLFTAVEEAVIGNLLFKERAGFLARLRELILLLLGVLALLMLLNDIPLETSSLRRTDLFYPLLLVLFQWLFSFTVHGCLRERELLQSPLIGKRGSSLLHALRDSSYQATISIRELKRLKHLVVFFQLVVFILLAITLLQGKNLSLMAMGLAALHGIAGVFFIGTLNLFVEEQYLLGNSIVVPTRLQGRRLAFIGGLLFLGAAAVLLVVRDASLLPLSYLLALLQKLAGLFRFSPDPEITEKLVRIMEERRRYYQSLVVQGGNPSNLFPALLILELIKRFLRTMVGTALFLFLVSPFLSEYFLKRLKELHPFEFLRSKLKALAAYLILLYRRLRVWLRSAARGRYLQVEVEQAQGEQVPVPATAYRYRWQKKRQMSRVLKAFIQLIRWGESRGVHYFPWNTPQEYALRMAEAMPAAGEQLVGIVWVFEEVMFSTHLVARERITGYYQAIRRLRKQLQ